MIKSYHSSMNHAMICLYIENILFLKLWMSLLGGLYWLLKQGNPLAMKAQYYWKARGWSKMLYHLEQRESVYTLLIQTFWPNFPPQNWEISISSKLCTEIWKPGRIPQHLQDYWVSDFSYNTHYKLFNVFRGFHAYKMCMFFKTFIQGSPTYSVPCTIFFFVGSFGTLIG